MSFSSGFGLIATTAGLASPLAIAAAAAAIAPLGNTLAQFSRWEDSAALAEEAGDPRRNVPRAVFASSDPSKTTDTRMVRQ
jgi:amino acid transporter